MSNTTTGEPTTNEHADAARRVAASMFRDRRGTTTGYSTVHPNCRGLLLRQAVREVPVVLPADDEGDQTGEPAAMNDTEVYENHG